eukprot:4633351-Pleurochrysis_carterae.AAC.1
MALEHQRLLDIADVAAAGQAQPPGHPPFARPIPVPLALSAHGLKGPNSAPPQACRPLRRTPLSSTRRFGP